MSSLLRNARSGSAILTPVVLVLQFISGVFIVFTQLPTFLQHVADIFPLKWLAQGMRSVFLPDRSSPQEASGSWQHGSHCDCAHRVGRGRHARGRARLPLAAAGRPLTHTP